MTEQRNQQNQSHQWLDSSRFNFRRAMKKIDFSLVAEVTGVALATIGIGMLSLPIALIVLGTFLVWITEKAN
jgi:hypothetical protein